MLLLLRQLRQKMLTSNKITTYLFYAIGEIFLVVIGILIAVSIDNWNEGRVIRLKEEVFLSRIKEEAQWNITVLSAQIEEYRANSRKLDSIASLLSQSLPANDDLVIPAAPYFIGGWMLKTSAYTELVSSGTLSVISDIKLREILDEAASMQIITSQALDYWRAMSIDDASIFRPYRKGSDDRDTIDFVKLDYDQMIGDPLVIGGFLFWSNANLKFAKGIEEFKLNYQRILDRIDCLESKSCND